VAIFALIFGSFVSLLSYRLAKKEPIVFTRSKCTSCGLALKSSSLIPLFSWIFQKGKCLNCFSKISVRYPLIELSFLLSFLTIFFVLDQHLSWKMVIYFLITSTLIAMCIIDLEEYFIPDSAQYFLAILATILLVLDGGNVGVWNGVKSGLIYLGFSLILFLFFYLTVEIEAIGIDDIKLFFTVGLLLGTENFLAFSMFSGIIGFLFGLVWKKFTKEDIFPFAPAISLSTFFCLLFGSRINPVELLGWVIF
jgi:prepilin signal peptidase PulO-like enzyme (type II secretory pathway)